MGLQKGVQRVGGSFMWGGWWEGTVKQTQQQTDRGEPHECQGPREVLRPRWA